ncbi:MFS transporter [Sphingobium sp. HBC34]|uniref:MFS transporter n=1 Tax=Sphingobium cyanobacteriorum TaxID=3063954 RepID=A0ABT8ZP17_9SPHN|nr:MFS transporter [Sphingobium sp. HBC34]MDO7836279.1 MFS transporter [Sphingobium sp. HBC34]
MTLSVHRADAARAPDWLPIGQLLTFTVAGFLAIMTENMPAGLLPQIGKGLGVSEAMAGQMVTLYALGSVVAAIPVIAVTRRWRRRPLFLSAIAGLLIFNSITALSAHFGLTMAARFFAGMAAGVVWGLVAGYARRLAPPHLQGRAMAIVGIGQPIALSLGVPLGAWLGALQDWRLVFWMMSGLALLLVAWVRLGVPDHPGQPSQSQPSVSQVIAMPGVRSVLLVLLAWILAHNILYTYVAPFLRDTNAGIGVDVALLIFGLSSIAGIVATGALVDRHLRLLTLTNLAMFIVAVLIFALSSAALWPLIIGLALWGFTFGGAPTLLQTELADVAGEQADIAQSVLVTVFNLAVAGGGMLGGIWVDAQGAILLPWLVLPLAILGWTVTWQTKAFGRHS